MSSSEEKVANIPFAGTPVSRKNSFRDRKKEKFKRHLASLTSPSNKDTATTDGIPSKSNDPALLPKTPTKSKPKTMSVLKTRTPPAAFRSLQSKTAVASDTEKSNPSNSTFSLNASPSDDTDNDRRFSKRQIRYVATSPSEESEPGFSFPRRPIRSLMSNPSEDSIDSSVPTKTISNKKMDAVVLPKVPKVGNPSETLVPTSLIQSTKATSNSYPTTEDDACSDASAPTLVQSNKTSNQGEKERSRGRSSTIRRHLLGRSSSQPGTDTATKDEGRSGVDVTFDEMLSRSTDLQTTLVKTVEITSKSSDSKQISPIKKKDPSATTTSIQKVQGVTQTASITARLPGVSSLKSFPVHDTPEEPKTGAKTSKFSFLSESKSISSIKGRSRSLPRGNATVEQLGKGQDISRPDKQKASSKRCRSYSCGRKSRLVDQIARKQNAVLQDRNKIDHPEQDGVPCLTTHINDPEPLEQTESHVLQDRNKIDHPEQDGVPCLTTHVNDPEPLEQTESQLPVIHSLDSRDLAIGSIDDTDSATVDRDAPSETILSVPSIQTTASTQQDRLEDTGNEECVSDDIVAATEGDDAKTVVQSTTATEVLSKQAELVHDNLMKHNEEYEQYEDPPLQELESEVSCGFDMRSIHDALPSDIQSSKKTMHNDSSEIWALSNMVFEEAGDEKKEDRQTSPENFVAENGCNATLVEEKKELTDSEAFAQAFDPSWDASAVSFAENDRFRNSERAGTDAIDMFDTSSWAGGTETRFSDVSLSKLTANIESEKQFVSLMMEEMNARALTDDESRMLFEAQQSLQQAEEAVRNEIQKLQNDDEPLITRGSGDDDGIMIENTVPLEERLKRYEDSSEIDDQSTSGSSGNENQPDEEEDFDDRAEFEVPYVGQEDFEPEEEFLDYMSPSNDQSATAVLDDHEPGVVLDVEKSSGENNSVVASGQETVDIFIDAPPPPPPGMPKKKKKRSKSQPSASRTIPLISPPPEDKLKKWNKNKFQAQDATAATKELESHALVSTANSLQILPEESLSLPAYIDKGVSGAAPFTNAKFDFPSEIDQNENSDTPDIHTFISGLSEDDIKDHLSTSKCPMIVNEDVATSCEYEGEPDPSLYLKESTDLTDKDDHAVMLDMCANQNQQPSLFSSLARDVKLEKVFQDKLKQSGKIDNILVDQQLADKVALATSAAETSFEETFCGSKTRSTAPSGSFDAIESKLQLKGEEIMIWFCKLVLKLEEPLSLGEKPSSLANNVLLDPMNFNALCQYLADNVNEVTSMLSPGIGHSESVLSSFDESTVVSIENTLGSFDEQSDIMIDIKRPWMRPPILSESSRNIPPLVVAANSVSFFALAAKLSKISSPFGDKNPFLTKIVESSLAHNQEMSIGKTPQEFLFDELDGRVDKLIEFAYQVKCSCDTEMNRLGDVDEIDESSTSIDEGKKSLGSRLYIVPDFHPSPFESSVDETPRIVAIVLSFLGDPVAVCRMKLLNRFCHRLVTENEHILMQNAVRTGGIEMSVRPAFWIYVTLQKCHNENIDETLVGKGELSNKAKEGEMGKWHNVIERDVARSFGNMPPHKTGAKLRNDSIVRALVTYGQNRTMKRGVRGGGEPFPTPEIGPKVAQKSASRPTSPSSSPPWEAKGAKEADSINSGASSETPTDTVSDWGGVSPKGSFAGSVHENECETNVEGQLSRSATDMSVEELALSGNSLTQDAKVDLRNKLSFVLHCLAATHEEIGYCQGMDYVVAHLLRILQETVKWKAANHSLPEVISTACSVHVESGFLSPENLLSIYKEVNENLVVEEVVLRIMDTLFMHYNLRHMYWPELRCLKTCCRVFERLIQIKLPVLADHFEHHELNVGLFALGWFQTLFLYLPSMPSATVCHIWDIWLVERSFKIFFRVGTAILFLSQPTLLNHELEGMMTYLNTIPDATLLRPDILIPCALNIKVTNRMLQDLESEVMQQP
ncbi:Rab-GTPase-TBC domain containing protein [Nitzschia inconspicua]|uniref:Rab-GTPase-TBC domain containing protein n=1 Tax=Nitzschia inconspicua TaxID=303405 RepID=A0A9K3L936_9STRA|nr:Rab-GTPase-TBC domain containing protein [Nitzschia inconspicua]